MPFGRFQPFFVEPVFLAALVALWRPPRVRDVVTVCPWLDGYVLQPLAMLRAGHGPFERRKIAVCIENCWHGLAEK